MRPFRSSAHLTPRDPRAAHPSSAISDCWVFIHGGFALHFPRDNNALHVLWTLDRRMSPLALNPSGERAGYTPRVLCTYGRQTQDPLAEAGFEFLIFLPPDAWPVHLWDFKLSPLLCLLFNKSSSYILGISECLIRFRICNKCLCVFYLS